MQRRTSLFASLVLAAICLPACAETVAATTPTSASVVAAPSGAPSYVVGGHVTGLRGVGLVLRTASGDHARVMADGEFAFGTPFDNGASYSVSVEREPISPVQSCVVEHRAGRIAGRDATDIVVTCTTASFEDAPAPTPEKEQHASR